MKPPKDLQEKDLIQVMQTHPDKGYNFSHPMFFLVEERKKDRIQLKEAGYGNTEWRFITTVQELEQDTRYAHIGQRKSFIEKLKIFLTSGTQ